MVGHYIDVPRTKLYIEWYICAQIYLTAFSRPIAVVLSTLSPPSVSLVERRLETETLSRPIIHQHDLVSVTFP